MRNQTFDRLFTHDFVRMCTANMLLHAALYMILPLLPFVMSGRFDVPVGEAWWGYASFAVGCVAAALFNAWLCDTYKRKYVFMLSSVALAVCCAAMVVSDSSVLLCVLMAAAGACYATASASGITVSIDITESSRRSAANRAYSLSACVGLLVGTGLGTGFFRLWGFETCAYVAAGALLMAALLVGRVYVAFRAPVGVSLVSMDRFFLPRAWVLFFNVGVLFFVAGLLAPLAIGGNKTVFVVMALLSAVIMPLTRMFVKLSHHCQRSTANATCYMALNAGLLVGMSAAFRLMDSDAIFLHAAAAAVVGLLMFVAVTLPYFHRHIVRN